MIPDVFFSAEQQKRLSELMANWRLARDSGATHPLEEQSELDQLVQAELEASRLRAEALLRKVSG
jgi:hypothetical protein